MQRQTETVHLYYFFIFTHYFCFHTVDEERHYLAQKQKESTPLMRH